jgi:hypothetical protein
MKLREPCPPRDAIYLARVGLSRAFARARSLIVTDEKYLMCDNGYVCPRANRRGVLHDAAAELACSAEPPQHQEGPLTFFVAFGAALWRASLELATDRWSIVVDRANEALRGHVDDERRAVAIVHRHVAAVSDEDRQLVPPLPEARVIEPVDPHERRKFRETTGATPEAGWGNIRRHFPNPPMPVAARGAPPSQRARFSWQPAKVRA